MPLRRRLRQHRVLRGAAGDGLRWLLASGTGLHDRRGLLRGDAGLRLPVLPRRRSLLRQLPGLVVRACVSHRRLWRRRDVCGRSLRPNVLRRRVSVRGRHHLRCGERNGRRTRMCTHPANPVRCGLHVSRRLRMRAGGAVGSTWVPAGPLQRGLRMSREYRLRRGGGGSRLPPASMRRRSRVRLRRVRQRRVSAEALDLHVGPLMRSTGGLRSTRSSSGSNRAQLAREIRSDDHLQRRAQVGISLEELP